MLGDDGYEIDFTEAVTGNRSPVESPLMDAIGGWLAENDPGAEAVPIVLPAFTDSRWFRAAFPDCVAYGFFPQRHQTVYETWPLMHAKDERIDVRDLGFAAVLLPRPPRKAPHLMPVPEDKLRLGGMALRNGLLVHGPTHWAAAVRTKDGEIKVGLRPEAALQGRRRRPRPARARAARRGLRRDPAGQEGAAGGQAGVREPERARRRRRHVGRGRAAAPPRAGRQRASWRPR